MTEADWNTCRDPRRLLQHLSDDARQSDLNLFGCACCRRIWSLMTDERLRRGVEARERYEEKVASKDEMEAAERDARIARLEIRIPLVVAGSDEQELKVARGWAAGAASNASTGNYRAASDFAARAKACVDLREWHLAYEAERAAQCDLLRSIVGNPFRDSNK